MHARQVSLGERPLPAEPVDEQIFGRLGASHRHHHPAAVVQHAHKEDGLGAGLLGGQGGEGRQGERKAGGDQGKDMVTDNGRCRDGWSEKAKEQGWRQVEE